MEETDTGIPVVTGFMVASSAAQREDNEQETSLKQSTVEDSFVGHPDRLKSTEELVFKEPKTDDDADLADLKKPYHFGFKNFHPKSLQIFANKKVFSILMCVYIVLSGSVVAGINSVNVSSFEVRYQLTSTLASLIFAVYDIAVILCIILVSYIGGKSHKPRFLGISVIILGVGNLVSASPQFFFGPYKQNFGSNTTNYEACSLTMREGEPETCIAATYGAYVIILIGQFFLAVGSAPIYTVGIAYIDEIVRPRYVSLHIGVVLMFGVIGPAIGYLLGSSFLSIYVDPWRSTDLEPTDPTWVGAWWIGPLLMGSLCFIVAVPFFMFPKWLPDSHLVRAERAKEMAKIYTSEFVNDNNLTLMVKKFPVQIKQLLTNASFMATSFALAMIFVVKDGVVTFGPKYIEAMFGVTATTAGLLVGGIGVSAAAVGVITGALIVHFWKPLGRKTTIIQLIVVTAGIPFVLVFLLKCPTVQVAGITTAYPDGAFDGRDSSACAMNCSCQSSVYEPVCGSDGITYFSPCRAGCQVEQSLNDSSYSFQNCLCISNNGGYSNATAVEGACDNNCIAFLLVFSILLFILVFMLLTIEIPYYHYTLRVVADDQRPLALGLQSAIYRTFGSIPGPLLFGAMVDLSCVEWDYNCGSRGNCWIYDNDKLSVNAIALCLPFAVASAVLLFIGMITYPVKKTSAVAAAEVVN